MVILKVKTFSFGSDESWPVGGQSLTVRIIYILLKRILRTYFHITNRIYIHHINMIYFFMVLV